MPRNGAGNGTRRKARGFTLIELLIVVTIVAVASYAAANNGAHPTTAYVTCTPSGKSADTLGNKYTVVWPDNPWTAQPMANTGSALLPNSDFASGAASQALVDSMWSVVNGQLVPPAAGGSVGFGSTNWTDLQPNVNGAGSGTSNQGDFAYAYDPTTSTTCGLVGGMSGGAWVVQPLR